MTKEQVELLVREMVETKVRELVEEAVNQHRAEFLELFALERSKAAAAKGDADD